MRDNEFGYTRWGMDWVRLAEPLSLTRPEPLLPRARSIARHGGVVTEIEGTTVRASIHRGGQASVTHLEFEPLPRASITAIAELLPATAVELTDAHHDALTAAGLALAPRLRDSDCSCSARTPRCLHFLATCYALARQVDENPRLALDLQAYHRDLTADPITDAPPPRWTSIDSLDPATYFATLTG
ncbi:hypothetical protein NDR87_14650 [Nocardia sp. CDC159]|uniref:SWIM-type domain-containing protein n=1 Tax=Nocardia pulmonis TaxID=2951408 RepID=A0A9X2IWH9_9NOCA|nr:MULTISPECIES: hypothetical protein [Nocardia]MCM6774338.1 hypothetical protein [Nocardia pulmonis]MCM6787596.1 hypothetical protein [Nocardia sp. CDC159]